MGAQHDQVATLVLGGMQDACGGASVFDNTGLHIDRIATLLAQSAHFGIGIVGQSLGGGHVRLKTHRVAVANH